MVVVVILPDMKESSRGDVITMSKFAMRPSARAVILFNFSEAELTFSSAYDEGQAYLSPLGSAFLMDADKLYKCSGLSERSLKVLVSTVFHSALTSPAPQGLCTPSIRVEHPNVPPFPQSEGLIDIRWMAPLHVRSMLHLLSGEPHAAVHHVAIRAWVKAGNWLAVRELLCLPGQSLCNATINLQSLGLDHIPPQLEGISCNTLDFSDNQIQEIPEWLLHARISSVVLKNNPLNAIHPSYLRDRPWEELKPFLLFGELPVKPEQANPTKRLVFVGGPHCVKAGLLKCLMEKKKQISSAVKLFPKTTEHSPVIQVHKPFKLDKKDTFSWAVWELGGHNEDWNQFYPCFFLSDSLFVLFFDASVVVFGPDMQQHQAVNKLNFWLSQIDSCSPRKRAHLALNSPQNPKVILVGFYQDGPRSDSPSSFRKGLFPPVTRHWATKIDFCGCFAMNLGDGSGYTFNKWFPDGQQKHNIVHVITDVLKSHQKAATPEQCVPASWVNLQRNILAGAIWTPSLKWSQFVKVASKVEWRVTSGKTRKQPKEWEEEELRRCMEWLIEQGSIFSITNPTDSSTAMEIVLQPYWFNDTATEWVPRIPDSRPDVQDGFWRTPSTSGGTKVMMQGCLLNFGFFPIEEFTSVMLSLQRIPDATTTLFWRDGMVMSKKCVSSEKDTPQVFELLINRVVDTDTQAIKVEVAMKTLCNKGQEITWKNNLMTVALNLLNIAASTTLHNASVSLLFICPKCLKHNLPSGLDWGSYFGNPFNSASVMYNYISQKKIMEAVINGREDVTGCMKHPSVALNEVAPEDFFNPSFSNRNSVDPSPHQVTVLYSNYKEPNKVTNALEMLMPNVHALNNVPDHRNVAKFFGVTVPNGVQLLGMSEHIPHLVIPPLTFLPPECAGQSVLSLADLLVCFQSPQHIQVTLWEKILSDVAKGLQHLHSQYPPVVHGDVHVDNVLVTSLDVFGPLCVAKITHGAIPATYTLPTPGTTTRTTSFERSVRIMCPEKIKQPDSPLSPQSDVWNFGILVHNVMAPHSCVTLKSTRKATEPACAPVQVERFQVAHAVASGSLAVDTDHCVTAPPLPMWAHQLISCCLVTEPSGRPTMVALNNIWGYCAS
ncbi:hypothetical protein Pelo_6868 [Pelomyxa schiedti]|nr:hypothetical protein Pelo_6868 [Pelomyxa schiedti]